MHYIKNDYTTTYLAKGELNYTRKLISRKHLVISFLCASFYFNNEQNY